MVYCHVMNTYTNTNTHMYINEHIYKHKEIASILVILYSFKSIAVLPHFFPFVYLFHLFIFESLSRDPNVISRLILSSLYGPNWSRTCGTFPIYVSQMLNGLVALLVPNRKYPPIAK